MRVLIPQPGLEFYLYSLLRDKYLWAIGELSGKQDAGADHSKFVITQALEGPWKNVSRMMRDTAKTVAELTGAMSLKPLIIKAVEQGIPLITIFL